MIRPATRADIPRIIELGTLLHGISSFSKREYVPEKAAKFMGDLIDGFGAVFVAEVDGVIVGGMAGAVTEEWFSNEKVAYDYSIFVEPSRRNGVIAVRLIKTFEEWARMSGAKYVQMGIGTAVNVEGTTRLYEHLGLEYFGPLFMKEI